MAKKIVDLTGLSQYDEKIKKYIADSQLEGAQSDWNVTDTTSAAFIKNKPTSLPASDTTSTYEATGTAPVNGLAVAAALLNYIKIENNVLLIG